MTELQRQESFNNQLSPDDSALIILAHQTDMILKTDKTLIVELRKNILALANMAKLFDLPTILTTTDPAEGDELTQEILEIYPNSVVVNRPGLINAWQDYNFKAAVKNTLRKQLIIVGTWTDICLVFTAISTAKEGYEVYVISDAFGSEQNWGAQAAVDYAMVQMSQAGCQMIKRVSAIASLQKKVKKKNKLISYPSTEMKQVA